MKVTINSTQSTLANTGSHFVTSVVITTDDGKIRGMMTGGSSPAQAAEWAEKQIARETGAKQPLDLSMQWR